MQFINKISQTRFLITGGAGFIGSNLAEYLLKNNALHVRILDNLSTGNIDNVIEFVSRSNFEFVQGDIRNLDDCIEATKNSDVVFNMAALGSVPRSIIDPITTNDVNSTGFVNVLYACKENNVGRVVFSSSSSVYGLNKNLPLKEQYTPQPISPYAVTKYANELYADVFQKSYGLSYIGLRYFNVFGPKQNPIGDYAAVIPRFICSMMDDKSIVINGNGSTSRDFTYIDNVIHANIQAAFAEDEISINKIYNISTGKSTSLNELYYFIADHLHKKSVPVYGPERLGDIKDSLADISQAKIKLNFKPSVDFEEGLKKTINWYIAQSLFTKKFLSV